MTKLKDFYDKFEDYLKNPSVFHASKEMAQRLIALDPVDALKICNDLTAICNDRWEAIQADDNL